MRAITNARDRSIFQIEDADIKSFIPEALARFGKVNKQKRAALNNGVT
mgnify:CR=1 FL=1